mmetsp:Transcript_107743/g.207229  ORF Transcript_107743/g.207229 Transcript_107743/m.207229 type:complete len:90 (+) Transcript_107743:3-272(+)
MIVIKAPHSCHVIKLQWSQAPLTFLESFAAFDVGNDGDDNYDDWKVTPVAQKKRAATNKTGTPVQPSMCTVSLEYEKRKRKNWQSPRQS